MSEAMFTSHRLKSSACSIKKSVTFCSGLNNQADTTKSTEKLTVHIECSLRVIGPVSPEFHAEVENGWRKNSTETQETKTCLIIYNRQYSRNNPL